MDALRRQWAELTRASLLSEALLRSLPYSAVLPLQSLRWRLYLGTLPIEHFEQATDAADGECAQRWGAAAQRARQDYAALRQQYVVDPAAQGAVVEHHHPLSLDEDSPWQQYYRDQELRQAIAQDVTRTFPEEPYFRQPRVQRLMSDLLFVYAKTHAATRYRQGMHELLAPLLMAVDQDAVAQDAGTFWLAPVLDRDFVEHDTFALFERLMRMCLPWYQVPGPAAAGAAGPLVAQCRLMMDKLGVVDPELHRHLQLQDIEPQLFGIRWYRLLFSRELPGLAEVFALWDVLLADDALRLCDWIGVVLLVANRRALLHGDFEANLTTLLHLPPLPRPPPEALDRAPPLHNTLQSPSVVAADARLAMKVPYGALIAPGTLPVQRLCLQAAYLRSRPSPEAAELVARQYDVWEQESWAVVGGDDVPLRELPESDLPQIEPRKPAVYSTAASAHVPSTTAMPQARKRYTSSTLLQQRRQHQGTRRSLSSSPPGRQNMPIVPPPSMPREPSHDAAIRSPGETVMALGSATAQATSIAAQCIDILKSQGDSQDSRLGRVAECLHAVSRVWQNEVMRSASPSRSNGTLSETPESQLRTILRELDRIHVSLGDKR